MTSTDTNSQYQVGDNVSYWRGTKSGAADGVGKITMLGSMGHSEVAWIENCRGCIALSHIERAA